jgi:S-adenosylmethionine-diacylgycerolhomoserine-N-methlytransferase
MPDDPRVAMDRMYRYQRHVYDLTRKFYLLGRDRLLASLPLQPGDRVCEIGCGTARNLIALGLRHPEISLYGVDASATMLATARTAVTRAGLAERIRLQSGLAEGPGWHGSFGLDTLFDIELFSYSLSMMPNWEAALDTAITNLRPGGTIAIVDFWDQRGLPIWFARALRAWLHLFGVHPRTDLLDRLHGEEGATVTYASMFGGYAVAIRFTKPAKRGADN